MKIKDTILSQQVPEGESVSPVTKLKNLLRRHLNKEVREEIQSLIDEKEGDESSLSREEKDLIASALHFKEIIADDVSVPRSDMVTVSVEDNFKEVIQVFVGSGHSRVPVYGEDLDEILGFITLKDILKFIGKEKDFVLRQVMRHCIYVPESLPIPAVLNQMLQNRVQIVIVVDEYGGTSGLLTFKDVMGELIGEIEDENEQVAPVMLVPLAGGRYQIDSRLEIDDLDDSLKEQLTVTDSEDYDTVGGFVLTLANRVPERGEKFELSNGNIILITDADSRRINRINFIPKPKTAA